MLTNEPNAAVAGMSWTEIAKSAYLAYAASTGNKNYQGLPMPAFEDLPETIRVAWECAVRQTRVCLEISGERRAGTLDEQQWEGYTNKRLGR